jgi:hypothetical protein
MNAILKKLNPSIDKRLLIAISGIIWGVVGFILCKLAVQWLSDTHHNNAFWLGLTGIILSILIHYFGFSRIVKHNIERILSLKEKICIFAFQPLKSYIIVVIMITMGFLLRHSPIPKPYLSVIYIGFGGAMFLSSLRYLWSFFKVVFNP